MSHAQPHTDRRLPTHPGQHTDRTVLISGASIAGPALALWLHRYGFTPTVVERAPELRTGGYKVDLRGDAIDICARMGVLDDVRARSTGMRGGSYVDDRGRTLAELPAEVFGGREGDDDEIMRGDLARIMYEKTHDRVEYVFGDSIAALDEDADGITVTFASGAVRRFGLVVGADGMHSNTRRLVFGEERRFKRHLGAYISIFSAPNDLALDRWETYHALPGKLVCAYSSSGESDAKNFLVFRAPELAYDHRDTAGQRRLLVDAFEGDGWMVPRMLDNARAAEDFYFDALALITMDRWSKGRVVLLGDAAHCTSPASGQGTGLALTGAYVLAGELAAAHGDHRAAFAAYERVMRPGIALNQRFAERFAEEMTLSSPRKIAVRMWMLRILPHTPWKNLVAKKVREDIQKAARAIPVKDYTAHLVA
ncbi:FAD-dependent monooxygenase [Streptomyces sp. NPDC059175]|uniref:FAD-dependent monooxygenase n=1 Tax=Streptomyces sp. NPDC059175 TaxID=3346757 RepID=UPI00368B79E9